MDVIPFVALIMHLSILSPIGAEVGISGGGGIWTFSLKKKNSLPPGQTIGQNPPSRGQVKGCKC